MLQMILQEILEEAREAHDTENQEREMKLDVTLDRLRQESTEEALDVHLEQCMGMLQRIKEGYVKISSVFIFRFFLMLNAQYVI